MFLGPMLVMFLRGRLWPVGACALHIQPAKQILRMSTKLAFPPTFVLPVTEIVLPMCHKMIWRAVYRAVPGKAHYYIQGCQQYPVLVKKIASQTI